EELAPTQLEELGGSARDNGDVLPALGLMARERPAVEEPVRVAPEERGERRAHDRPVEQQVHAHDRRVLELGLRLAQEARAFRRRHGDDDTVRTELVERSNPAPERDLRATPLELGAGRGSM